MFPSFNPTQPPSGNNPFGNQQGGANPFYQVKEEDTDLGSVAGDLGVPLPDLVAANDGAKTLPPAGSYIATGPGAPWAGYMPENLSLGQNAVNQNPNPTGGMLDNPWLRTNSQNSYGPSLASGGGRGQAEHLQVLQQQIASGQAPDVIPASMLAALGATPESMTQNGYVFNSQTGQYALPGTPAAGAGAGSGGGNNITDPYWQIKSVKMGRRRGYVSRGVADLLGKRRRRRAGARARADALASQQEPQGTTESPGTVLQLNLGSG